MLNLVQHRTWRCPADFVIPAKAGIHEHGRSKPDAAVFMDPGLRRDDGVGPVNCRKGIKLQSKFRVTDWNMPTDPAFYLFAIPAVVLIGLAKGGFSGLGALGTPLMALGMADPVRAAAILLPILIVQDVVAVAAFRKSCDRPVLAA